MPSKTDAKKILATTPKLLRSPIARGLAKSEEPAVDRQGGDAGAGIIRGMAVISRGEALGHDMWIDADMLQQVAAAINASDAGAKARFTHPSLSGDGLGKFTGRVKNASVDGDVVRADLHLSKTAHETPDGDLAGYVMGLAEDDPHAFGNSISFDPDYEAEEEFMIEHGAEWKGDGYGYMYLVGFESPDKNNVNNYPHARLKELRAVDAVDEPAANPHGLFHRGQELAQEAESLLSYSLGLSKERPQLVQLDLDADRVGGFVKRFLDRHGLSIAMKGVGSVTKTKLNAAPETEAPQGEAPAPAEEKKAEEKKAETPAASAPVTETPAAPAAPVNQGSGQAAGFAAQGKRFLDAFGAQGGVWFAEGKSFDEAQQLYLKALETQNAALSKENGQLKGRLDRGEAAPVSHDAAPSEKKLCSRDLNLGPSLSKFANGIKMPGRSNLN